MKKRDPKRGESPRKANQMDEATRESVDRLFTAVEMAFRGKTVPTETVDCAAELTTHWKFKLPKGEWESFGVLVSRCEDKGTRNLLYLLGALVVQMGEPFRFYQWMAANRSIELGGLRISRMLNSPLLADMVARHQEKLQKQSPAHRSKQRHELRRRKPIGVGLIESEFGFSAWIDSINPYLMGVAARDGESIPGAQATCLDDVFAGQLITVSRSMELFGVQRYRFPKGLAESGGKRGWHDYRTVVKIMDAFLAPPRPKRRKRGVTKSGRRPWVWLSTPEMRTRVLDQIAVRVEAVQA
ncbi:MAG: hypothetical protein ABI016_03415, partial [Chthoniobacterales bacterium]